MNKETKIKVLIFAGIGLFVFLLLLLFLRSSGTDKQQEEITVHSDAKSDFTLDEMLKINDKTKQPRTKYTAKNNVEVLTATSGEYEDDPQALVLQQMLIDQQRQEDSLIAVNKTNLQNLVDSIKGNHSPKSIKKPQDPPKAIIPVFQEPEMEPQPAPRFFTAEKPAPKTNTVEAVVHGEQELHNGSAIKLRLLSDLKTPSGYIVPKDNLIYGRVAFSGERIAVKIESIRIGDLIIPLQMQVYDRDGMPGINVPHSVKAEIAQEATEEGVNEMQVPFSSNIFVAGASAVAQAGKSVLRKQTKVIKVTVKSNYKIYLHNEKV